MRIYRTFLTAVVAVMTYLLFQALTQGDTSTIWSHLWTPPWGRLTLVDAVAALTMLYLVITALEPRWSMRLIWLVGVAGTGSAAVALFFLLHARRVDAKSLEDMFQGSGSDG